MTPAQPTGGVVAREDAVEIVVDEGADERERFRRGPVVLGLDHAALQVLARERGIAAKHDSSGFLKINSCRSASHPTTAARAHAGPTIR